LAAIASILDATKAAPAFGRKFGCSDWVDGGKIQVTVGRLSFIPSYSNLPTGLTVNAFLYRTSGGLP